MDITTQIQLNKIKNEVDRVLHAPYNGFYGVGKAEKKILEMTLVLDRTIDTAVLQNFLPELIRSLKRHDEVFRDVRMNLVEWLPDGTCNNNIVPMLRLTMCGFYEEWEAGRPAVDSPKTQEEKTYQNLYAYLKLFHARSRLVMVISAPGVPDGDVEAKKKELLPFLGRKLIRIHLDEKETALCSRNDF